MASHDHRSRCNAKFVNSSESEFHNWHGSNNVDCFSSTDQRERLQSNRVNSIALRVENKKEEISELRLWKNTNSENRVHNRFGDTGLAHNTSSKSATFDWIARVRRSSMILCPLVSVLSVVVVFLNGFVIDISDAWQKSKVEHQSN